VGHNPFGYGRTESTRKLTMKADNNLSAKKKHLKNVHLILHRNVTLSTNQCGEMAAIVVIKLINCSGTWWGIS
jgi:hypothetical protein